MKKIIIFYFLAILMFPSFVYAHPGNTASDGCHYCWTNCSYWGEVYGVRHCHGGSSVTPSIPTCPLMSTYNSLSGKCECFSGYVVDTDFLGNQTCVSGDSVCQDDYGYGAEYDSLTKKCGCRSNYIMSGSKCVEVNQYCRSIFGYNSRYNSLSDRCECGYGYVIGSAGDCILEDDYCEDVLGDNSRFNSISDKCECDYGYEYDSSGCVRKSSIITPLVFNSINMSSGCGVNSSKTNDGQCKCNGGYIWRDAADPKDFDCILSVEPPEIVSNVGRSESESFVSQEKKLITKIDKNLSSKLKGKILLQVENKGQAWYVNPKNLKKYYMADGNEAYSIMRTLGVGITNNNLEKIKTNKNFAKQNSGKIFLQVESLGEAYYIDFNGNAHYLKDGNAAYTAMRNLGLGIKNSDLRKIEVN